MKSLRRAVRSQSRAGRATESSKNTASVTASQAKSAFGRVLERAIRGETVYITKHDDPKAVLISLDRYRDLQKAPELELGALAAEFDAMLDRMQTPEARAALDAAYRATPRQLGLAAVRAARKNA